MPDFREGPEEAERVIWSFLVLTISAAMHYNPIHTDGEEDQYGVGSIPERGPAYLTLRAAVGMAAERFLCGKSGTCLGVPCEAG